MHSNDVYCENLLALENLFASAHKYLPENISSGIPGIGNRIRIKKTNTVTSISKVSRHTKDMERPSPTVKLSFGQEKEKNKDVEKDQIASKLI